MKILIIDDHALIREGLCLLLPTLDKNLFPVGAATYEDAFLLLDREKDISLILMDLKLPGISGTDGIILMRNKYPEIPVVVISGVEDRTTIIESIRSGALGFIPKSYTGDRMFSALQYILVHHGIFLPAEAFLDKNEDLSPMRKTTPLTDAITSPSSLGLTDRQTAVLYLVLQGKSNKVIARELNIESSTVRTHVTAVLKALNVTTRTEAVIAAYKLKLIFSETL